MKTQINVGRTPFLLGTILSAIFCVALALADDIPESAREATEYAAKLHIDRGLAHLAKGDEASLYYAKGEFEFVINMHYDIGHKSLAYFNLGVISFMEGNLDHAIKYYQSAIALKPDYAEAYFNMGAAYYKQGNLKNAEESFLRSLELQPKYGRAHYSLGSVYFDQKKYDLAGKHADKAEEYGIAYKTLKERLAKIGGK